MQKQLTLIFGHFEKEHFGKDVFLVPYYLGKYMNCHVTIVYPQTETNRSFPREVEGVELVPVRLRGNASTYFLHRQFPFYTYLHQHAKHIDYLMIFHHSFESEVLVLLYKIFNPQGVLYTKLDVNITSINTYRESPHLLKRLIHHVLTRRYHRCVDLASCETTEALQVISQSPHPYHHFGDKLLMMENGFDEFLLRNLLIRERSFAEKENVMITVGRLGTLEKNTSMLLEALKKSDLKEWKFYLIGPIEPDFKSEVEELYRSFPDKQGQVIFTGPIYDKKELWEYYNRAKVFVLTSRWESYALVLNEAQRFRNYILSTQVGAFTDITENGKYGVPIRQEDALDLADKINGIVSGEINVDVYGSDFDTASLSWEFKIRPIANALLAISKTKNT